jgi:hypothetical protein
VNHHNAFGFFEIMIRITSPLYLTVIKPSPGQQQVYRQPIADTIQDPAVSKLRQETPEKLFLLGEFRDIHSIQSRFIQRTNRDANDGRPQNPVAVNEDLLLKEGILFDDLDVDGNDFLTRGDWMFERERAQSHDDASFNANSTRGTVGVGNSEDRSTLNSFLGGNTHAAGDRMSRNCCGLLFEGQHWMPDPVAENNNMEVEVPQVAQLPQAAAAQQVTPEE